ncbi:ABC transporter ATP-binding protein [Gudongella sp. DL1XJH-153]|uniref:ABC transporter ATP-binding protein n=1 Tax=Gudongella sp. DL1XJH-153 TaxID=3409804 RepID=UPI003BB67A9E
MIELVNITKSYDGKINVIENLNLKINKGEIVVLIGESGCGKTTTLRMINRLNEPTGGTIMIDGEDYTKMSKIELRRQLGYVIQKVGLMPHLTVGKNIEIIPELKGWDKQKRKDRAYELLNVVDLPPEEYYDRYPHELSGGQQQRIGVARALAVNPDIILMDEPFSALDPVTREQLQKELLRLQDDLGKTIVFVTHDMDEALKIGDKIAVMKDGKILQYDTPEEILKNPANDFVEYFVGKDRLWKSPEMLRAEDIMHKTLVTIGQKRTPAQVIEVMKEKDMEFIFIVEKETSKPQPPIGYITRDNLRKQGSNNVKMADICNREFITIQHDAKMTDVLKIMEDKSARNLPVLDDDGNLIGMITTASILNLITKAVVGEEESQ